MAEESSLQVDRPKQESSGKSRTFGFTSVSFDSGSGSAKELAQAKQELNNLKVLYENQRKALNEALTKLRFLKLPNCDTFCESNSFKGDVTFVIQASIPRMIHAHRCVLAGRSSVFERMFEAGMQEEQTGRIHISDASYATMRAVVNYCYTADMAFDEEVVPEEVLKVAHKYDIALLRTLCDRELCERLSHANLALMLRLSRTYDAQRLRRAAHDFFRDNFDLVHDSVMDHLLPS